jgi:threonylcarbamoyladenosine tRNA methylthiotransferase MtaB
MRLSSIEANEVDEDFFRAAGDCEHLCPQFHPALQSGSDTVLTRMRRRYRVGRFLEKLERIREILPQVAFTTDLIVGFPGETNAEFAETLETCERAGFMKIHAFPYSARRGTPAALLPNQVSPETRKSRMQQIAAMEQKLSMRYYETLVGRPLEILVQRESPGEPGWVRGFDRTYVPVKVRGTAADLGEFVQAQGTRPLSDCLQADR